MHIKLVKTFSTDISDIVELTKNENACFVSTWDKSELILNIDKKIIEESFRQQEHINSYIMSKNMETAKEKILGFLSSQKLNLSSENVTIVSNGTSAAFISILQTLQQNCTNFLCIGPIYFTYMQLLNILNRKLYHYSINLFEKITLNISRLKEEIIKNDIHCIILIQPFFGSGINLKDSDLHEIIAFCEKHKIYLLLDYVYGNMNWNSLTHIHNLELIKLITNSKYCLLYESISKRIFINGIKNAVIFGSSCNIQKINVDSEICLGSISYIQESLLQTIYSSEYLNNINFFITDALNYAKNNYFLLQTLILGTSIKLCKSTDGYFTLMGIPKYYFESNDDYNILKELYNKTGVVTIPHTRYYYFLPEYYCFRINLVIDTETLLGSINKILDICSD